MKLNNEEMLNVKGGAITAKLASLIGGAVIFLIGLVDGFINPKKCN